MERRLAAIFSTDVAGYSRLMGDDEEATIHTLKSYREVLTTLIEQHHGRVVDSPGDNMLAEFASAVDAVKSAVAIQHELKTRNAELEAHRQMAFRIGLNVGDVITDEGRLYGDGVNIAARLEGLADPGGICISEAVHMQIENKLDLAFFYQGEQTVKNISKPIRVYKVELDVETAAPSSVKEPPTELPLPDKPSIAVLPFTNMSNDPEQEYFSDGMTDDIITDLSKISELFVIARNSTFTYKGQAVDVGDVSKRLGVHYILEGSVRKAGNRIRINVQLIDARTGGHLWAERYDRELEDIFSLQDEMTQKIVFALKVTLTPEEQARFRQAPTTNLDAYDAYLRGMELLYQVTQETNPQARSLFEQATALDPQYAAAYARLGYAYFLEGIALQQDPQLVRRALEMSQKAVSLDDALPMAHEALGVFSLFQKQYARASTELEHALTVDPNYADAYGWLGNLRNFVGQPEEAIPLVEQAVRLNPHGPSFYDFFLGHAYRLLGRYDEAIEKLQKALAIYPTNPGILLQLTATYSEAAKPVEAQTQATLIRRSIPGFSLALHEQMIPYQDPAEVERYITALRKAGLE